MYIEKIHIDTFGKLSDIDLELSPGVNIIEGANESGKSTVAEFIRFILYGMNTKDRERLLSWRSGGAAGSLTVVTEKGKIRIERALAGSREAVQLVDGATNMPIRHALDGTTPGELLFGVDADMFFATAFVSQLGGTQTSGNKVVEGIENILFSADENVNTKRALSKLDAARVALLHKNEKGGKLYEIDRRCAELEVKLAEARRVHDEILEKETQLSDSRLKYERASGKAADATRRIEQFETKLMLELFERRGNIEAHIDELKAQIEKTGTHDLSELRAMETTNARVTALRHEMEAAALREVTDSVEDDADEELDEYIELGGREALESESELCKTKSTVYTSVGIISAVLALAAFGFGAFPLLFGGRLNMIPVIGGVVLAALAFTMLLLGAQARKRRREIAERYDFSALDAAAAARKAALDAAKFAELATVEAKRRYDEACDDIRRTYGCEEHRLEDKIAEMNEKLRGSDGLKSEYDKNVSLLAQIDDQLRHYNEEELRKRVDPSVDISDIDVQGITRLRREAEFSGKMAESLAKYITELEKTLAGLYPIAEDPIKLTDSLSALKAERGILEKKLAAYVLAYEKLNEAGENLRSSIAPRLANDAAAQLAHITDGKYRQLGVGADLAMSVDTECGTKMLGTLSAGTQDAAYISLRMALISLLYRREQPPMIFDEAFVRQDDVRLAALLKLVHSGGVQSMIFTATDREAQAMSSVGGFRALKL